MRDLRDLIGDTDVADLLELYGEPPITDPGAARERLDALLRGAQEGEIVAALFAAAGGFAAMAAEVMSFCADLGVGPAGQVQLDADGTFMDESALNSGWARDGGADTTAEVQDAALAVGAALSDLADRLAGEDVTGFDEREELTSYGERTRRSTAPQDVVLHHLRSPLTHRRFTVEVANTADRQAVARMADLAGETATELAGVGLPASIQAGLSAVEAAAQALRNVLAGKELGRGDADPALIAIERELEILLAQARSIANRVARGRRAEAGFRDFLRSEFWFQRWRIYELWLLVRVLAVLRDLDGDVRPQGVADGVWHLRYGRAEAPAAVVRFPAGRLLVYYQLFRPRDDAADMPDLVVTEEGEELSEPRGRALLVLDPKHGRSYSRSRVDEVGRRYMLAFEADITAIVNYYALPSYEFDELRAFGSRTRRANRMILASDVAPGTLALRRLELALTDVLLDGGYGTLEPAAQAPRRPRRRPTPRTSVLLYVARKEREVDEPAGLWVAGGDGGTRPVSTGARFEGTPGALDASPDGDACSLRLGERLVLARADARAGSVLGEFENVRTVGWNRAGTRYAAVADDRLMLYARAGELEASVALPARWTTICWQADGSTLLLVGSGGPYSERSTTISRLDDAGRWSVIHEQGGELPEMVALPLDGGAATLLTDKRRTERIVRATGVESPSAPIGLVSASPTGALALHRGPYSRRHADGVRLLRIEGQGDDTALPLVRFTGELADEPRWGRQPRWAPDGSRVAFFVRRDLGGKRDELILIARVGDRVASPAHLSQQQPAAFAWTSEQLVRRLER